MGGLVAGSDGKLYGTLSEGGTADAGGILRFDPADDSWSVAAAFDGAGTGARPMGELHAGSDGALYGMCAEGGAAGTGPVFRYAPGGSLVTLASFGPATPGAGSATGGAGITHTGGLRLAADGTLYGVTPGGGAGGGGVVFRITQEVAPFVQWLAVNGIDPATPLTSDGDGDNLALLVEYALGGDPGAPDAFPTLTTEDFGAEGRRLCIAVPRDPDSADATIVVEASASLAPGSWEVLATSAGGAPFPAPATFPATPRRQD